MVNARPSGRKILSSVSRVGVVAYVSILAIVDCGTLQSEASSRWLMPRELRLSTIVSTIFVMVSILEISLPNVVLTDLTCFL